MHSADETLTGWYKSSYSGANSGECLEVASGHTLIPVRDSKTADGPVLLFSAHGWSTFLDAVKSSGLSA
ncbi:DUF397 domain-containing protein [Streptomyces sp. AM 2-1-1]|uniref:DUF397 domain-containing protein n=1 Tax=Streptomyces sp. AM 2-1-1 TaxID=3028709 RepID=UPI0023BA3B61|nr:DUF397 domain-containing protein [Streptomyces sp. AM 2-1-1]WEH41736.1 DUF397 domain-containing protein [Streptomyces sp. AM 2-1-1]